MRWFSIFFRGCNHDKSVHNFSDAKVQNFSISELMYAEIS